MVLEIYHFFSAISFWFVYGLTFDSKKSFTCFHFCWSSHCLCMRFGDFVEEHAFVEYPQRWEQEISFFFFDGVLS